MFWHPSSDAVDAFSKSWYLENNWLIPPFTLVCRTIKQLLCCRAEGTLIVPKWPSPFWTLLFDVDMKYRDFVYDDLEFAPKQNMLNKNSSFGSDNFNSRVLAVRLCAEYL